MTTGDKGRISTRVGNTIEDWSGRWGDRLSTWGAKLLDKGMTAFLEDVEPETIDLVRGPIDRLRNLPDLPEDVRGFLDKSMEGTKPAPVLLLILLAPLILIPLITGAFRPLGNLLEYGQEMLLRTFRFDPHSWMTLKRRFPEDAERFLPDMHSKGWTEDRIEALEKVTRFYPPPADLVRWQAREVFEPKMVEKYGLTDELGGLVRDAFYKAGMDDEQIDNYWMAHWEHASYFQVVDMLRRGLITEADMQAWFRLVEIPPYWRDLLIGISWEVPTRVDVRRFWDMGTIDESRLREIYTAQGYHGKDLDDYVLWTKVYVAFPDLVARYRNGHLKLEEVKSELVRLGMTETRAQELLETKFKAAEEERTTAEKSRTRSDIIKGVKQGVITRAQGVELLQDLNYSAEEANFILEVNIPQDEEEVVVAVRQLTKSDILKGLKEKLLTEDEAQGRLLELRYSPRDAELLMDIFRAALAPPEDEDLREASKADIIAAVKKGVLVQEEAYLMLQGIGFSPEAAEFILEVRTESSPFSPRNYEEFTARTGLWRQTVRADRVVGDDELRAAGSELVKIKNEVKVLRAAVEEEERTLVYDEEPPESATVKLRGMQVALNRAEAELERVQQHYNTLVTRKKWENQ